MATMTAQQVIDKYYEYVNKGDWQAYLTLFDEDVVLDEQLAGHVEGLDILRGAIGGLEKGYAKFQMIPSTVTVADNKATVLWHCSAESADGGTIETNGANFFEFKNGLISYMRTHHDVQAFSPFTHFMGLSAEEQVSALTAARLKKSSNGNGHSAAAATAVVQEATSAASSNGHSSNGVSSNGSAPSTSNTGAAPAANSTPAPSAASGTGAPAPKPATPQTVRPKDSRNGTYDFVIVGSGSAGSVLAARLTENPNAKVLLLEAGAPAKPVFVDNPSLWFMLLGSGIDWGYQSVGQPGLNGRKSYEPRGKRPGGSSNMYIMMHIRGHRSDYDNWAYNGAPGWSYDDVLPYFKKQEDYEDTPGDWVGKGGPLKITNAGLHNPNPTSQAFLDACRELGYPETTDFNGPNMVGAGWHHINVYNGQRYSVEKGYLDPARERANLTVSTSSTATRLLFEGKRVVGVEYIKDGVVHTAKANYEVIVSAGAIESPKLLMLSGIGAKEELARFDIPQVAELPGVGRNFHNHVLAGVINEAGPQVPQGTQNLSEAAMFLKSHPGMIAPDIQMAFVHVPFNIIVGQGHPNSVSILPGVVRPQSRGWIKLASANPFDKPMVNPNYLSAEADVVRLTQAMLLAREIFATRAFSGWVKQELMPGPGVRTVEQMRSFVRDNADSYHHQAGSCKMGSDDMSVVDPNLRVYGVEGLRIADASVMPQVPSGNCHAGIVMIAEKLADMLKAEYMSQHQGLDYLVERTQRTGAGELAYAG